MRLYLSFLKLVFDIWYAIKFISCLFWVIECVCVCMGVHVYIYICMCTCMIIHIYIYIYMCVCVCVCVCAGTYKFSGWCLGAHLNHYEWWAIELLVWHPSRRRDLWSKTCDPCIYQSSCFCLSLGYICGDSVSGIGIVQACTSSIHWSTDISMVALVLGKSFSLCAYFALCIYFIIFINPRQAKHFRRTEITWSFSFVFKKKYDKIRFKI